MAIGRGAEKAAHAAFFCFSPPAAKRKGGSDASLGCEADGLVFS